MDPGYLSHVVERRELHDINAHQAKGRQGNRGKWASSDVWTALLPDTLPRAYAAGTKRQEKRDPRPNRAGLLAEGFQGRSTVYCNPVLSSTLASLPPGRVHLADSKQPLRFLAPAPCQAVTGTPHAGTLSRLAQIPDYAGRSTSTSEHPETRPRSLFARLGLAWKGNEGSMGLSPGEAAMAASRFDTTPFVAASTPAAIPRPPPAGLL